MLGILSVVEAARTRSTSKPTRFAGGSAFSEAPAWRSVGKGWQHLHGSFPESGFSLEWHDFTAPAGADFDWSRSFHPDSVEICLNLSGTGEVSAGRDTLMFSPQTAGFYSQSEARLKGVRRAGERHQFITVELSRDFLQKHMPAARASFHPELATFLSSRAGGSTVSESIPLSSDHQALVMSLRKPPVYAAAQQLWDQAKALEVGAAFFFRPPPSEELFCEQQKRLSQDRARRVIAILKENLSDTPSLEEIARRVGCSSFYLSRTFTQEIGQTMTQHLRQLRMEQAAAMLLEGKLKITSIALEVGYSSASHFSTAFHETFGCCPGLYSLRLKSQRKNLESR